MKKLVIFGTGSLGQLAYFHFSKEGQYEVAAFTVNEEYLNDRRVFDLDVVPYERIEQTHPPEVYSMFVAIGYRKVNKARAAIFYDCRSKGYELASCIGSRFLQPEHVKVGENCLIMPNVIIQPFAEIGNDVVIWDGSYVGYHSRIGDHSYVAAAVVVAGNVEIGPYCFLGVNATIRDGLTVAPECVIGAGAVILKNTEPGRVYRGQSAEVLPFTSSELRSFK